MNYDLIVENIYKVAEYALKYSKNLIKKLYYQENMSLLAI